MQIFRCLLRTCGSRGRHLLGLASNLTPRWTESWKKYSTCPEGMKVTICGAAGATGQPLALLLKQCPLLDEIALYDICATCGYGMELSHVDTKCKVSSFSGRHMLCDALKGSSIVVIVARNCCDTFENNAPVVTEITLQICNMCPTAFIIVATEPVESMVPLVGEIMRLRGAFNPRYLLGCVELNCVRANTVLSDFLRVPPESVRVPVIGGATPQTMVPVLSAAVHPCIMTQEQIECVTSCIMSGNEAVCAAKGCCTETACLAGAYAVARTTINVVKGLQGKKILQVAYVDNMCTCVPDCQFFASELTLGPSGIEKNLGIPELTKFENCLLCNCLPYVRNEIARAICLVYAMCTSCCCSNCYIHPCTCFSPPCVPCVPPVNWTCGCPDACRDEYLASICREMTCKCGSTELCWRPRDVDYDAARAANLTHQMPLKSCACPACRVPRSVQIEQKIREKAMDPCKF
ncbi:malate dehydrogenase, mitochondrial-like isoform X1 [Plodia interpunctella]|uniref:malate dehydrogenase, mitochondrial-like isoform X1 n=2 Tax=Plodia interpunctella TaxID=58824 RepID=UPI002367E314|nr:malate dehydrogenase, mitochondrial-like isoform X1 [Plodia interpunctella]